MDSVYYIYTVNKYSSLKVNIFIKIPENIFQQYLLFFIYNRHYHRMITDDNSYETRAERYMTVPVQAIRWLQSYKNKSVLTGSMIMDYGNMIMDTAGVPYWHVGGYYLVRASCRHLRKKGVVWTSNCFLYQGFCKKKPCLCEPLKVCCLDE